MRLGIDLGGTKNEAAVINDDGVVVWRHRIPSERQTYKTIIQSIHDLTLKAESETGFQGNIGIAIPGQYSPSLKVIKGASLTSLITKTLLVMSTRPPIAWSGFLMMLIALPYQKPSMALAEYDTVFGIILGTGCGSGIVAHGKLLAGAHGIAGNSAIPPALAVRI